MSENNPFYNLAPFIQEYIYNHGWNELREIQVAACDVLFNTNAHLLLSSGTASGKTEAAFLPIITMLSKDMPESVGVLYIAPLKALINDQFERLNDLLKEADIPVFHWHGDVPQGHKKLLFKEPKGILQITPESLESMLINKNFELVKVFYDLKFIIIDEVHAFMGTDRGNQVMCLIQRLSHYIKNVPRRIGLSATLGDYALAEKWLSSGTDLPVMTPKVNGGKQKIRLAVEHFYNEAVDEKNIMKTDIPEDDFLALEGNLIKLKDDKNQNEIAAEKPIFNPYWNYVFEKSKNRKCIIFGNMREQAEVAIATLRQIAEANNMPDIYHVHHGSISSSFREYAEDMMKVSEGPVIIGATVTLELGIDIGKLERIIQLDAPFSVSSFIQRLGRSGRRGNASEMFFVCQENKPTGMDPLPVHIPWRLLQCIAIIQLYIEERWIEPVKNNKYPFSLLYHQTMSTLASAGELTPQELARRVLTLTPFKNISLDDYRILLNHLINIGHIESTEDRGLLIGLKGEKVVRNYQFYAVFPEEEEYTVMQETNEIGRIEIAPPVGERVTLAGRNWEVLDVDLKRRIVFVKHIKGKLHTFWNGDAANIHIKILERMKKILFEDTVYPYLQPGAVKRLDEARYVARNANIDKGNIFRLGGNSYCILPWMGSIEYYTLLLCIKYHIGKTLGIKNIGGLAPYYITMRTESGDIHDLYGKIKELIKTEVDPEALFSDNEVIKIKKQYEYKTPKFDKYIPVNLLRKEIIEDYMDLNAIKILLKEW